MYIRGLADGFSLYANPDGLSNFAIILQQALKVPCSVNYP